MKRSSKKRTTKRKPPKAPAKDKAQIVIRKAVICEKCDGRDTFRRISGVRPHPMFGQAYARCNRCGHKAHIRILHGS